MTGCCESMKEAPLVSIKCTVYNHEPFLRQCLDGFVMQQTTFPFEAIVHDDASTDGSAAIIREYAEKYPDIIKPIYETENRYHKGFNKIINAAMHPDSKYIALCEGDDYWTDPHKLQLQVDFLESHPDYVLCCANHLLYNQDKGIMEEEPVYNWVFEGEWETERLFDITLDNYFKHWWVRTLTVMYRRYDYFQEMRVKSYQSIRDDNFYYTVLSHGKGVLMKDVVGVYRRHSGGIWAGNDKVDNYKIAVANAFEIYRIEGDKRAFIKTREFTIRLLRELNSKGKKKECFKELKSYYCQVPVSEFAHLIKDIAWSGARNKLSAIYHRFV